jgi:hypothetical protein
MRARIGALLLTCSIFASASRADAASVNIEVVQQAPGSTSWSLQVTSAPGVSVGGLALLVSDSLTSFTPAPLGGPPPICVLVLGGCDLQPVGAVPGFNLLSLSFTPALPSTFSPLLLGTFEAVSSTALVQVLPADVVMDGTVFDAQGLPIQDFSIRVVPEPAASALLLLAALASCFCRNAINPAKALLRLTRP